MRRRAGALRVAEPPLGVGLMLARRAGEHLLRERLERLPGAVAVVQADAGRRVQRFRQSDQKDAARF